MLNKLFLHLIITSNYLKNLCFYFLPFTGRTVQFCKSIVFNMLKESQSETLSICNVPIDLLIRLGFWKTIWSHHQVNLVNPTFSLFFVFAPYSSERVDCVDCLIYSLMIDIYYAKVRNAAANTNFNKHSFRIKSKVQLEQFFWFQD